ncbi:hypothetical protein, partial [Ralstonia solanacearum]|uniref:hypothetical protein n=1 Tax=Ralstonia solanacearum TaxID=305 RepID=UPI001E5E5316
FSPKPLIYKECMPRFHPEMPRLCHNLLFGRLAVRTYFFSFFLLKSKRKRKKAEKRETTGMPRFGVAGRVGVPRNGGRATGDFVAGQIAVPQGFAGDLRACHGFHGGFCVCAPGAVF